MSDWMPTVSSSANPVPESEPEPTSEPVPEHYPEADQGVSNSEPLPQWDVALQTWKWAWDLHWAGLGSLFLLMALYAAWSIVIISSRRRKRRQPLSLAINVLLLTLGVTRALFLFINPYESEQCNILSKCPVILTRLLFGMGLPSFSAAFSLIQLMFLQLTKLTLYPKILQSTKFLTCIISVHFGIAIIAETIIFAHASWRSLALVCQGFFIVFCFLLSTSFAYSGYKVIQYAQKNFLRMQHMGVRMSTSRRRSVRNGKDNSTKDYRPNMTKLVKITYFTAFLGIAGVTLQLYAIFGVHNMYVGHFSQPRPWPWFVFQTLFRIVELLAACTMAYVGRRQACNKSLFVNTCISRLNRRRRKCGSPIFNSQETDSKEKSSRESGIKAGETVAIPKKENLDKEPNGLHKSPADNPLFLDFKLKI